MKTKQTKRSSKVFLSDLPTEEEMEELNKRGNFELSRKRGYPVLLSHSYNFSTPTVPCTMECPIKEWVTI